MRRRASAFARAASMLTRVVWEWFDVTSDKLVGVGRCSLFRKVYFAQHQPFRATHTFSPHDFLTLPTSVVVVQTSPFLGSPSLSPFFFRLTRRSLAIMLALLWPMVAYMIPAWLRMVAPPLSANGLAMFAVFVLLVVVVAQVWWCPHSTRGVPQRVPRTHHPFLTPPVSSSTPITTPQDQQKPPPQTHQRSPTRATTPRLDEGERVTWGLGWSASCVRTPSASTDGPP